VIDEAGEQIGIMAPAQALEMAEARDLDLVEIAPMAKPPVCRIMNYGKYLYQQSKKQQEAKKHSKHIMVKEIKFRPKTDEHDYQFKKKHIIRFLSAGNLVKITVMFRGRELAHKDLGYKTLDRLVEELDDLGTVEKNPKLEGRNITMTLTPKKT
jgi:translation initiation factor IF-3